MTTPAKSAKPRMRRAVTDDDKLQRRNELLVAAKQVFGDRGFHATTMADVAREAGVSYGVAYWYFESKDELFRALMSAEEEALRERISAAFTDARTDDLQDVLHRAVKASFEFFDADRAAAALLFRDALVLGHDFERHLVGIYGRFIDDLEGRVKAAQREGKVMKAPPRLVAFALTSLVAQLAIRRLSTDDGLTAEQAADFVVRLAVHGIGARPASIDF